MTYITDQGTKYLIRGPYTAAQLRQIYQGVLVKYPGTALTFRLWLVKYGKVYHKVK